MKQAVVNIPFLSYILQPLILLFAGPASQPASSQPAPSQPTTQPTTQLTTQPDDHQNDPDFFDMESSGQLILHGYINSLKHYYIFFKWCEGWVLICSWVAIKALS